MFSFIIISEQHYTKGETNFAVTFIFMEETMKNKTKKEKLDRALTAYLDTLLVGVKVNLITKWVIDRYVIKNIPIITQAIYDLLKAKVKGL